MKLWIMGISVLVMWLGLAVGALGVFAGVPLFTGHERPARVRQVPAPTPEPVTHVVVAPPKGAINAPAGR